MEVEIRPEPHQPEAVLAAIRVLLSGDGTPPAYRSAWRESGIRENAEGGGDQAQAVLLRKSPRAERV